MDYIITTEQLTKKYKNFISVNNASLHIRKGSIYGFLGPNGAGKSTTMKMLLSLILSVVCVRSKESRSVINIASTAISAFWALLMVGIVALAVFLTFVQ